MKYLIKCARLAQNVQMFHNVEDVYSVFQATVKLCLSLSVFYSYSSASWCQMTPVLTQRYNSSSSSATYKVIKFFSTTHPSHTHTTPSSLGSECQPHQLNDPLTLTASLVNTFSSLLSDSRQEMNSVTLSFKLYVYLQNVYAAKKGNTIITLLHH